MYTGIVAATLLLMQGSAAGATADPPSVVSAPRVNAEVKIDGVLDEAVWQQATVLTDFNQYEPVDGRPALERTEVRVWYAPDAIYFGVHAYDSQPSTIRATRADRDNIGGEDGVVIYLDTFHDRRRAFLFGANPLGVQMDGVRSEGAANAGRRFGGGNDLNPDYLFESKGRVTEDGYVIEFRIPFKSLRYPSTDVQTWGLQIERVTQRTGYTDTWTPVQRGAASYLVQAGTLTGLSDLHRGVVVEAQPFVTAQATGAVDANDRFRRGRFEPETGINARLGFTSVSLDATINPDFSQVESDAGQVTINERFALFFAEKRPFFLEGIELFGTPNQLVYTRRIVDPIAGGKLTGKVGSIGVAHLTAVDNNADADGREALFNVTRLRRDFGSNSLAGLTMTDRSLLDGDAYNRVVAADTRIVFKQLYFAEFQYGRSWTRDNGDNTNGAIWKAEVDRTGRLFGFNYSINGTEDAFRADAGFVNRTGIVNAHAFNRLRLYGAPNALVETVTFNFNPSRVWDYDDIGGEALEGDQGLSADLRLRGGWNIDASFGHGFVNFEEADYVAYTNGSGVAFDPLDRVSGFKGDMSINTPTYQKFDAGVRFGQGKVALFREGGRGWGREFEVEASLRPSTAWRVDLSSGYEQLWRDIDDSEFGRTILTRAKVEYQPTRALFFRVVGEHRAERQSAARDPRTGEALYIGGELAGAEEANGFSFDLLASLEPTPGTVAFFGYGSTLAGAEPLGLRDYRRQADGFFVKLAYQFRR